MARVVTLDESGTCVPRPASLHVDGHLEADGCRSIFELVSPTDAEAVHTAWLTARRLGAAQVETGSRSTGELPTIIYFVDARHRHGVFVCVVAARHELFPDLRQESLRPRHFTVRNDQLGVFLSVDAIATRVLGWNVEELVGRQALEIIHPDDIPKAVAAWIDVLTESNSERRVRARYRHRDGSFVWFELAHHNHLGDPEQRCVTTSLLDITDEVATQEALRLSEQSLLRLADALPFGVLQVDCEHRVVYRNERFSQIVGKRSGTTAEQQLTNLLPPDRDQVYAAVRAALEQGSDEDIEATLRNRNGERHCSVALRALTGHDGAVSGAILCVADVTDDVQMRKELRERANFDRLTRCYNRASILSSLDSMLLEACLKESGTCAIFADLDHFKPINDELGHAAGDALLRTIAERLLGAVRAEDRVGRLGGDEFLVVCPNVKTPQDAMTIAGRMVAAMREPIEIEGRQITPSASIGVSWCSSGSENAETMVERADAAMYLSKSERKGMPVLAAD